VFITSSSETTIVGKRYRLIRLVGQLILNHQYIINSDNQVMEDNKRIKVYYLTPKANHPISWAIVGTIKNCAFNVLNHI
jgi:hypothetical protein